ncbi:MAG TPA: IclR family transcriptional regulator [Burkholderiaceae bacterium]
MASREPDSLLDKPAPKPSLSPAVSRAILLLNLIAETGHPLSLSELAARLGIVKSAAFGLCSELMAGGLLSRQADGYQLGAHVMAYAHAYLKQTSLPQLFLSQLSARQTLPQFTVNLSVLDGLDVVYLMSRPGSHPLGIEIRMGTRLPAFTAATGRAILSTLAPEHLDEKLARFPRIKLTAKTEMSVPKIRKVLALAASNGYSVDDEEVREGMLAYGAPVFGPQGTEAVGAVAVALQRDSATPKVRKQSIAEIRLLARTLSHQLGAAV